METKTKPCPKCKAPMIISSWDGWRWMCFHCDNIGRKATDEEIERQEDEVETMIKIIVPGEPIAKARPKFARRGKFVQTYNIQETEEGKFIAQVLAQANGKTIDGPIRMTMIATKSRPKSHYGTGRNSGKLKPSAPALPATKPDLDNYIKFLCDCFNEILFRDDAQIVGIKAIKRYGKNPRTEILLEGVLVE